MPSQIKGNRKFRQKRRGTSTTYSIGWWATLRLRRSWGGAQEFASLISSLQTLLTLLVNPVSLCVADRYISSLSIADVHYGCFHISAFVNNAAMNFSQQYCWLFQLYTQELSYFKSWKMMLWKCCTQYVSEFGKLSSGHRTGKGQFSFQSQRKAMPKNTQTTTQLHSSHTLPK